MLLTERQQRPSEKLDRNTSLFIHSPLSIFGKSRATNHALT